HDSTYLKTKPSGIKVEGAKDAKRRKRLEDELEWVRSSPRARQSKSRARLERYEGRAAGGDKHRKLALGKTQTPRAPRLGTQGAEVTALTRGLGAGVRIAGLGFSLPRT